MLRTAQKYFLQEAKREPKAFSVSHSDSESLNTFILLKETLSTQYFFLHILSCCMTNSWKFSLPRVLWLFFPNPSSLTN